MWCLKLILAKPDKITPGAYCTVKFYHTFTQAKNALKKYELNFLLNNLKYYKKIENNNISLNENDFENAAQHNFNKNIEWDISLDYLFYNDTADIFLIEDLYNGKFDEYSWQSKNCCMDIPMFQSKIFRIIPEN